MFRGRVRAEFQLFVIAERVVDKLPQLVHSFHSNVSDVPDPFLLRQHGRVELLFITMEEGVT
jgi:hypothetical protein